MILIAQAVPVSVEQVSVPLIMVAAIMVFVVTVTVAAFKLLREIYDRIDSKAAETQSKIQSLADEIAKDVRIKVNRNELRIERIERDLGIEHSQVTRLPQ